MKFLRVLIISGCGLGLVACGGGGSSKEKSFLVDVAINPGGILNPAQATVTSGDTTNFSVTPTTGYHVQSITGCGGVLNGLTYLTGVIGSNCTVKATFERNTYTLTANAAAGGSVIIQNAKPQHGDTANIIAIADGGYGVSSFSGCGAGTTDYSVYTTAAITADCAVSVTFKKTVTVQGAAAEGTALANAQVNAKCSDGSTFSTKVNTDTDGKFIGQVGEHAFPCALKVATTSSPVKTYYSIANQAGITNINLLTDISLVLASGKSGADWYASNDWSSVKTNLAKVQTSLKSTLYDLGYVLPAGDFLPFTSTFSLGDSWDKLLDQIQTGVKKSPSTTYDSLVVLLKSGDTNLVPSPTGGNEPTAEVCFNPVLYAEGTTFTTKTTKPTYVEGNTTYFGYESTYTATNEKIVVENGLPILTRLINQFSIDYYSNTSQYFYGDDKLMVKLDEKTIGFISYLSKIEDAPNLSSYYLGYFYSSTYKDIGYQTNFKASKNNILNEEFIFTSTLNFNQTESKSESNIKNTKTFKGLINLKVASADYRVCDFEVQSVSTNQHSLIDGTTSDDSTSNYHEYFMVGSGLSISEDNTSVVLNGQELLNGLLN